MKKSLASIAILSLFVYANGTASFFPSLRLVRDTQWDPSFFLPLGGARLLLLLWAVPVGLGLWGWSRALRNLFFRNESGEGAAGLGFALTLAFFSLYIFALGINGILAWPATLLFFLPFLPLGWRERKAASFPLKGISPWWILPMALWGFEYLSPPLVWDSVLDHFRYAREISRLGQIPLHWVNHTGDMPKAGELILAGFWSLGGEGLSKLSSGLPLLGILVFLVSFSRELKAKPGIALAMFLTCPFYLAIFSWGYAEGFLAYFEVLSLYCFWKALRTPGNKTWLYASLFFLGFSFSVKYTALLAAASLLLLWLYEKALRKTSVKGDGWALLFFLLPFFPWLLKGYLAYGNPLYPLAVSWFPGGTGYSPAMERGLWLDTGFPSERTVGETLRLVWNVFFTPSNAVGAAWTPLAFMALPWVWKDAKRGPGFYWAIFSILFFGGWLLFCTSLRHASAGTLGLLLLGVMGWREAFREKSAWPRKTFALGCVLSLWLSFSAQLTTTAPYACALGLEDPLKRLKRHYSFSLETDDAYRAIERESDRRDKVVAFAVFQTYPLERTAFIDFKWKKPIFLEWASQCRTAEQLARKLREEGAAYFLLQRWEAGAMSRVEKDFKLEGMPPAEYIRFWSFFMEPIFQGGNCWVYRVRKEAAGVPRALTALPGVWETIKRN